MQILAVMQFRVTRGAGVERDDEETDDLRDAVEQELRQRRFADVVRLEHDASSDDWILHVLMQELKLGPNDVYRMPGELDYDDLRVIADLNLPALRHGEFYIGSADWMYRNLLERVEAVVPIEDRALREKLWEILQVMGNDNRQAWDMQSDGTYTQRRPAEGASEQGTHQTLMSVTRQRGAVHAVHGF
jgi:polyphosphate kinase